ncbi:MAG TPA: DUF4920 domain-containing protein [Xanthomonadales bacterium]|nr:DUF4920 domain-containing protein [Xanthomonadales bacterium]
MSLSPTVSSFCRSIALVGILTASSAAFADEAVTRLSEPIAVTDTHEVFGAMLPEQGDPVSLAELVGDSEKYQDQEVLVATRIAKVCQKKGCFFVATEGAATARISFKDYSFFIPTDSGGKKVLLLGTFARTNVSEKDAEHYAADLGETTAPNPEQFQYSIVASAVQIPRG